LQFELVKAHLAPKVLKQQMVEVADESGQMMTLVKMI
jgi:hypothetical protein